jgi:hypothetical protein
MRRVDRIYLNFLFKTFQFLKTSKLLSSDGLQEHVVLITGRYFGPSRSHLLFYVVRDFDCMAAQRSIDIS